MSIDGDFTSTYTILEERIKAIEKKLPSWKEEHRAMPNHIARSALFSSYKKGKRPLYDNEIIWSRRDVVIAFTGLGLDETDAGLWLELLHHHRNKPLGEKTYIRKSLLLNSMNKTKGGASYSLLEDSLDRLQGKIKINKILKERKPKLLLSGSLLSIFGIDEDTGQFYIKIEKDIANLFSNREFSLINNNSRNRLSALAKSLQLQIATSSETQQTHSYDNLKKRLNRNTETRYLKRDLRVACTQLKKNKIIYKFDLQKEKLVIWRTKITS